MNRLSIFTVLFITPIFFACESKRSSTAETEPTCEDNCLSERNTCRAGESEDAECTEALNVCLNACDPGDVSDANAAGSAADGMDAGSMSRVDGTANVGDDAGAGGNPGESGTLDDAGSGDVAEEPFERYNGKWTTVRHTSERDECGNNIADFTGNSEIITWGVRSAEFVTQQVDFTCDITGTNTIECQNLRFFNGSLYFNWDITSRLVADGRFERTGTLVMECGQAGGCAGIEANLEVEFPCTTEFQEEVVHVPYENDCETGDIDEMAEPLDGVWATVGARVSGMNECEQTAEDLRRFYDWTQIGSTPNAIEFMESDDVIITEREGNRFTGERSVNYFGQDWEVRTTETIRGGYTASDRMYRQYTLQGSCAAGNCENAPVPIPCQTKFILCSKHIE